MNWNVIHSFIMIYVDGLVAFQLFAEVLLNLILDRCFWCAVFGGLNLHWFCVCSHFGQLFGYPRYQIGIGRSVYFSLVLFAFWEGEC